MRARINAPVEGDFSSEVRFQYVMQSSSLDSAVQIAQLKPGACEITIRASMVESFSIFKKGETLIRSR
jgi:hypothetical protein